ncbi:unnamed protein product, partial [Closterium sp. Naga37s-1]
ELQCAWSGRQQESEVGGVGVGTVEAVRGSVHNGCEPQQQPALPHQVARVRGQAAHAPQHLQNQLAGEHIAHPTREETSQKLHNKAAPQNSIPLKTASLVPFVCVATAPIPIADLVTAPPATTHLLPFPSSSQLWGKGKYQRGGGWEGEGGQEVQQPRALGAVVGRAAHEARQQQWHGLQRWEGGVEQ